MAASDRPLKEGQLHIKQNKFGKGKVNGSQDKAPEALDGAPSLEMAVNSIYVSREEVTEYRVTAQRTEAAERCSLRGPYLLRAEANCLILKDPNTNDTLYSWPYRLLRRYGRDKVMFSFEAGRRCQSGPGNFTFETSQGHEIFQKVEGSIRAQQGSENRLSCPTLDLDAPADNTSLGSDSGGSDSQGRRDVEEKSLKSRALPNLPLAKPLQPPHLLEPSSVGVIPGKTSTPPRSPVSRSLSCHTGDAEHLMVYSEPKDSVKGVNLRFDPLYSDPVDSVAGQDVRMHKDAASPLYSDLYEHVGYEVVGDVGALPMGVPKHVRGREEHIYDEPEGRAQPSLPIQLYSEVQTEATAWRRQANDDKVGYEFPYNPGCDDYSVPHFLAKRTQPRNKIGPKPIPAPKPQVKLMPKPAGKEDGSEKIPVAPRATQPNTNNNNGNPEPLYSQVLKPGTVGSREAKPPSTSSLPSKPQSTPPAPPVGRPQASQAQLPTHPSLPADCPRTHQDVAGVPASIPRTIHLLTASGKEVIYEDMGLL
ncbi:docking protein 1 isoform X2 [Eleutherodactylus coqui]|uniref:docking protein 1 isoform X2 n=1 Tax=Eleutherodactylus coqui TaxID=57060 RepID=UPI0034619440